MRNLSRIIRPWIAGLSVLLAISSCSDSPGDSPVGPTSQPSSHVRAERLAAGMASARASLARIEAAGHDDLVLSDVRALYESADERGRAPVADWIFLASSLRSYLSLHRPLKSGSGLPFGIDFEREGHPVAVLSTYARLLRERGIDLLVVPVPHRLQIYGDLLPSLRRQEDFPGTGAVYVKLLLALAEEGVEVVDLLPTFLAARTDDSGETDEHLYLPTDPHWTPRGLALAAELVASRVRAFDWFEEGSERAGEHFDVICEPGLHPSLDRAPPAANRTTVWYRRVLQRNGKPAEPRDRESPILLLGDSFAAYYQRESSDFCRHLYARLGRRIDRIHSPGVDGATTWKAVQRRGDQLAGKRLVIWVFRFGFLCYPHQEVVDPFE